MKGLIFKMQIINVSYGAQLVINMSDKSTPQLNFATKINLNQPLVMTEKRYRIIRQLLYARFVKNIVIKKMSK